MDEFWIYVLAILFIIVIFIGIPFNIISSKGGNKKVVIITNGVLIAAVIGVFSFSFIDGKIISDNSEGCGFLNPGLFSDTYYTGKSDEYYTFYSFALLGGYDFAVPAETIELPFTVSEGTSVIIKYRNINKNSYEGKLWHGTKKVKLDSKEYYLADNTVGIYRNYFSEEFSIILMTLPVLFIFNIIEAVICITKLKGRKKDEEV